MYMARQKLSLSQDERRIYNNEMHRRQSRIRRQKAEREAIKDIVYIIISVFETLGWEKTELVLGADEEMIEAVVDEIIKEDKFKITLGSKIGVKIK